MAFGLRTARRRLIIQLRPRHIRRTGYVLVTAAPDVRHFIFSSLTHRILFLNLAALGVLMSGILYINQFREGLIDARVESLMTQGEIIAGAIAASASVETNAITDRSRQAARTAGRQTIVPADRSTRISIFRSTRSVSRRCCGG
jgi:hypothetical protein